MVERKRAIYLHDAGEMLMMVEVEAVVVVDDVEEGTSWIEGLYAARRTRCWREEDSNGMRQISLWISLSL